MTGPLGPMDDDSVVDLLRAAGHGGREPSPADVSRAMTAGRRIRRRRQTAQALGSGLAIVAVLGVGITTVSALDDGGGTPVTSADDPGPARPAPAVGNNAALAAGYLAEDLGDGWVNEKGRVTLDPNSDAAKPLGEGSYAASATAEIVSKAAFNQVCGAGQGKQACEEVQTSDNKTLYLWDWADRDPQTGRLRGEAAAYRPLEKDKYQLVAISVDGPVVSDAQRDGLLVGDAIGAVNSWFTSMEGPLREAATDTRIENSLTVEPDLAGNVLARNANVALLLAELGPDFRVNDRGEMPGAVLRPGTPSAAGLPDGYEVGSEIWVKGPGDGEVGLEDLCTLLTEDDLRRSACTSVQTSDGRTVQVQTRHWLAEDSDVPAYAMLLAFFDRGDGTYVEVRMSAWDRSAAPSTQRQEAATSWLAEYTDSLAAVAADPRVQSDRPDGNAPQG